MGIDRHAEERPNPSKRPCLGTDGSGGEGGTRVLMTALPGGGRVERRKTTGQRCKKDGRLFRRDIDLTGFP